MFADDIDLVREMVRKYDAKPPFVDIGGLERPCVADYQKTVDAMAALRNEYSNDEYEPGPIPRDRVIAAQRARYLDIHRPLSFLGDYAIENPEAGGAAIGDMYERGDKIGTAILLSVLEHVSSPFIDLRMVRRMLVPGGLIIASVPFAFPYHPSPRDLWRFTPDGLRQLVTDISEDASRQRAEILECDWRLDIPAEAGVIDLSTGRAQTIRSCYIVARAA